MSTWVLFFERSWFKVVMHRAMWRVVQRADPHKYKYNNKKKLIENWSSNICSKSLYVSLIIETNLIAEICLMVHHFRNFFFFSCGDHPCRSHNMAVAPCLVCHNYTYSEQFSLASSLIHNPFWENDIGLTCSHVIRGTDSSPMFLYWE